MTSTCPGQSGCSRHWAGGIHSTRPRTLALLADHPCRHNQLLDADIRQPGPCQSPGVDQSHLLQMRLRPTWRPCQWGSVSSGTAEMAGGDRQLLPLVAPTLVCRGLSGPTMQDGAFLTACVGRQVSWLPAGHLAATCLCASCALDPSCSYVPTCSRLVEPDSANHDLRGSAPDLQQRRPGGEAPGKANCSCHWQCAAAEGSMPSGFPLLIDQCCCCCVCRKVPAPVQGGAGAC